MTIQDYNHHPHENSHHRHQQHPSDNNNRTNIETDFA
jgi:hypothetical protein